VLGRKFGPPWVLDGRRRSPDSCEYIEKVVWDSRRGVVLHLVVWARG